LKFPRESDSLFAKRKNSSRTGFLLITFKSN
jgi:hypothetical protein